jgi:hypothetical protein
VSDGRTVVARHPRLYGRDGEQLDPLHYLQVLERKPGAFDLARPIQRWAPTWPPVYRQYLDAARGARPEGATREFVRVLQLHARYPQEVLAAAVAQALAARCFSADGVEQFCRQATGRAEGGAPPAPIDLASTPLLTRLAQVRVPLPDPHRFDRLLVPVATDDQP